MGMLSLLKPSAETIRPFLEEQAKLPFSYTAVGATAETPPARFTVDHVRIKLGEGEPVFRSAIAALRRWEQLRLGWAEAWPSDTPIESGEVFAIMGRVLGLWWLNSCRIVYVVDETEPTREVRLRLRNLARPHRKRRGAVIRAFILDVRAEKSSLRHWLTFAHFYRFTGGTELQPQPDGRLFAITLPGSRRSACTQPHPIIFPKRGWPG